MKNPKVGDLFKKTKGDYHFEGEIIAVFKKLSGAVRVVGEDSRGILFIFNPDQIEVIDYEDFRMGEEPSSGSA